jgi:hypothetical protein
MKRSIRLAGKHPTSISAEKAHGALPSGPHFSGLIGGLHNEQVSFWGAGEAASEGIERMAELGSKTVLDGEVATAIGAGTANLVLSGGGINPSPESVSISFIAAEDYPLMTLVSMLAPSPDWFVGVDSLNLMSGGDWRTEIVVPLYVWDAGTDSGVDFTALDQDTSPADPITRFDTGLFGPPMQFVGTFTITRTDAPPVPAPMGGAIPRMILLLGLAGIGVWGAARRSAAP